MGLKDNAVKVGKAGSAFYKTEFGKEFTKAAAGDLFGDVSGDLFDLFDPEDDDEDDNPKFVENQIDGESPLTLQYFRNKKLAAHMRIARAGLSTVAKIGARMVGGNVGAALNVVNSANEALESVPRLHEDVVDAYADEAAKQAGDTFGDEAAEAVMLANQVRLDWNRLSALVTQLIPPSRRAKPAEWEREHWYSPTKTVQVNKALPGGSLEAIIYHIIKMRTVSIGFKTGALVAKAGVKLGAEAAKVSLRTAGESIPYIGFVGGYVGESVGSLAGTLGGWVVDSLASMASSRVGEWYDAKSQMIAQALHWQAYRELVVGRGQGVGPAMRILSCLWDTIGVRMWKKLGSFLGIGTQQALGYIKEPKGWLVFVDVIDFDSD